MKIHLATPYALDKNLGRAYNEEFEKVNDDDWVCLRDCDTMFLLPESVAHLYGYIQRFPDAGCFTCYSNRNHPTCKAQLYNNKISDNVDVRFHTFLAEQQKKFLYNVTEIPGNISGFLMLISKRTWQRVKFNEKIKCLGVDFHFSRDMRSNKKKILRMDGVYVWHSYRLRNLNDNTHLI